MISICKISGSKCRFEVCDQDRCAIQMAADLGVALPVPKPPTPRCGDCRYGVEIGHPYGDLGCRRMPPVFAGNTRGWPVVLPSDWCGEFQEAAT